MLSPRQNGHAALLSGAASASAWDPVVIQGLSNPRSVRDAIRRIRDADLVLADTSEPDVDVAYLLGIAEGLGRRTMLVSARALSGWPGEGACPIATGSGEARPELEAAIAEYPPPSPDPRSVAALLADEWVFGERLGLRRLVAFTIDAILAVGLVLAYRAWRTPVPADVLQSVVGAGEATLLVLILYRGVLFALAGTTLGMSVAGLRLIDADGGTLRPGQAMARSAAIYVAMVPFASSLASLFAPRHQVLEDMLTGTRVVRRW